MVEQREWTIEKVLALLRAEKFFEGCSDDELRELIPVERNQPVVSRARVEYLARKGDRDERYGGCGCAFLLLDGYVGLLSGTPRGSGTRAAHTDARETAEPDVTFLRLIGPALPGSVVIGTSCALLREPHTATIKKVSEQVCSLVLQGDALRALATKHPGLWDRALRRSHAVIDQLTTRVALHRGRDLRTGYAALFWLKGTTHGAGREFEVAAEDAERFNVSDGGSKQATLREFMEKKWVVKPRPRGKKYSVPDEEALKELAKVAGQAQQMIEPFREGAFASARDVTQQVASRAACPVRQ